MKWKYLSKFDPGDEYVALISFLPLRSFLKIPRFLVYTNGIQRQLEQTEGVIGYSLRAHFLEKRFLTLSVWKDDEALMDFVNRGAHRKTMTVLRRDLDETKFVKWNIRGSELPPAWEEALGRLNSAQQLA